MSKSFFLFSTVTITTSLLLLLLSCSSVPQKPGPEQLTQPAPKKVSTLTRIFDPHISAHGGDSGFILLRKGSRALKERLMLANVAEHTIEAQYYIWNSDKSGRLLARKLIEAADRGVSVRIILDDFSVGDRNEQLLLVNSHPNIEIRIYNPFVKRHGVAKWLNFAFDFDRLNRRMHNKTFTVDGAVAIVGGRNIGDEYFNLNEHINFRDLDLLAVGPVVDQVSQSFREYWNSPWAIPIEILVSPDSKSSEQATLADLLLAHQTEESALLLPEYPQSPKTHITEIVEEVIWSPAKFIYDQPGGEKDEAYPEGPKPVAAHILKLIGESQEEVLIESAYFVLGDEALALAASLNERGVKTRALTNSMASNDVLPNHASYAMVREDILKSGIELHELRPDAASCSMNLSLIGLAIICLPG